MSGLKFDDGTCFWNKDAGPGGCVNPCPEVSPSNHKIWELFDETWESGNFRGMDGDPVGRHYCCVESVARALGVSWDRTTFKRFRLIVMVWLESVYKKIDERNRERKKKK